MIVQRISGHSHLLRLFMFVDQGILVRLVRLYAVQGWSRIILWYSLLRFIRNKPNPDPVHDKFASLVSQSDLSSFASNFNRRSSLLKECSFRTISTAPDDCTLTSRLLFHHAIFSNYSSLEPQTVCELAEDIHCIQCLISAHKQKKSKSSRVQKLQKIEYTLICGWDSSCRYYAETLSANEIICTQERINFVTSQN